MNPDGYLLVYYKHKDEPEKFPFADHRNWRWEMEFGTLIITKEASRVEIPRESIEKVDVHYNSAKYTDEVEAFANAEHPNIDLWDKG